MVMQGKGRNKEKGNSTSICSKKRENLQPAGCGDPSYVKNAHDLVRLITSFFIQLDFMINFWSFFSYQGQNLF